MATATLTIDTPVNSDQAVEYASTLWERCKDKGDMVVVLLRDRGKVNRRQISGEFDFHSLDELQDWVNQGYNVYTSPCLFDPMRDANSDRTTRKAQDVVCVPGVWADMDVKEDVENLPQDTSELKRVFEDLPRPTMSVNSGSGGRHYYWLFEEPLYDTDLAKELTTKWIKRVSRIASKTLNRTIKFDSVGDLSRILRVPGTWRFPKSFKSPTPVGLQFSDGPRYTVDYIKDRTVGIEDEPKYTESKTPFEKHHWTGIAKKLQKDFEWLPI